MGHHWCHTLQLGQLGLLHLVLHGADGVSVHGVDSVHCATHVDDIGHAGTTVDVMTARGGVQGEWLGFYQTTMILHLGSH